MQPFRIAQQNSKLKGAKVGNFQYVQHPLHLGSLSGNLFDLILRNVKGSCADVERAASALQKSGFINYFGLQRLGMLHLRPTCEALNSKKWGRTAVYRLCID